MSETEMTGMPRLVALVCTVETFRPVKCSRVRWLDHDEDLLLFQQFRREIEAPSPSRADWGEWHLPAARAWSSPRLCLAKCRLGYLTLNRHFDTLTAN
jgi:hypothetical protein